MIETDAVVSGDGHLEVPPTEWITHVPVQFREFAPSVVTIEGNEALQVAGNDPIYNGTNLGAFPPVRMRGSSYWDEDGKPVPGTGGPAQRLAEQDQDGVAAEVLYSPLFMGRCLEGVEDKDAYRAMVSAYNEFLAGYCSYDSERLIGVGVLPNTGIDDSVKELHHIAELGLQAAAPRWFPSGFGLPTPVDDPFWEAALSLGIRVTPHSALGGPPNHPQRMTGMPIIVEPPPAFGVAARANASSIPVIISALLIDGVFDRFPELVIYFAEVNAGWLPFSLSMLDDSYLLLKDCYGLDLKMAPSEYALKHCRFGIVRDPTALKMLDLVPASNIIWGSDFPHGVGSWPNSQAWLDESMSKVSEADRRLITRDNALAFFGVERTS